MKKKKKLIGLISALIVLILLIAAYFGLKNYNEQQEQESETEDTSVSIASIPSEDITQFSYLYEGEKLQFEKEGDTWYYSSDKEFPVDQDKITSMIENFAVVKGIRDLGEQDNLGDFGLDDPSNEISVKQENGTEDTFYLGDENSTTGNDYLYLNNATNIYTVDTTMRTVFSSKLYDLAVTESLPAITSGSITKVEITQKDKSMMLKSSQDDSATWSVTGTDGKEKTADSTQAVQLLSNVTNLNYKEYIDYNCRDLSQYGLGDPESKLIIEYSVTTEVPAESEMDTEVVSESETTKTVTETKQFTLLIGSQNEAGDYYVKIPDNNQVHTMSADNLSTWLETDSAQFQSAE